MPDPNAVQSIAQDEVLYDVVKKYCSHINLDNPPDYLKAKSEVLQATQDAFRNHNATVGNGNRWQLPSVLDSCQIPVLVAALEPVCCINCVGDGNDPEHDLLAVYQKNGSNKGLYAVDELTIRKMIRRYRRDIKSHDLDDVVKQLKELVSHKERTKNRDLIAVNNGIFDFRTKTLMPFSPEYVFLSKSAVNYNPAASNPVIHNDEDGTDWNVEDWVRELSDDPEIVNLIWETMSAIVRPHVHWDKSVWFYSTTGNNGKGTLCELMRQLCGPNSYASISLADFGKDFLLEPLVRVSAIITDENDVGTFIDKAANLKAVTTGDAIQINRKYKQAITYRFMGMMVQCLNEMPRVKDRSDSFYRRQIFIPFEKCFTGQERKYIKGSYLHRTDVLQYVLYKVLHMNHYVLSEPKACQEALAEYKQFNDPVRQFAEEILPLCAWDLLPFSFLYDLYRAWMKRNAPSGGVQGRNTFINDLLTVLPSIPDWACPDRRKAIRPQGKMDWPEPLIAEYGLDAWANPVPQTPSAPNYNMPLLRATYNGVTRVGPSRAPQGYGKTH